MTGESVDPVTLRLSFVADRKAFLFFLPAKRAKENFKMPEIIYKEEAYKIIGTCFEVYKGKGVGFTEPIYQECLQIELALQQIPFIAQPELQLEYKGSVLSQSFKPDFICYGKIVVELKALEKLIDKHRAQTLNYLRATGFELALLVNFGHFPKLEYERLVNNKNRMRWSAPSGGSTNHGINNN